MHGNPNARVPRAQEAALRRTLPESFTANF